MRNSLLIIFLLVIGFTRCNKKDEDVQPSTIPLVVISTEPEGENCENGGVRIESGFDENENDQLDASEIKDVAYVCDGISEDILVVTTDEPTGENCADGGIRLLIGLDNNKNGELDTEEVQQISFICNGQPATALGKSHLFLTGSITNEEAQAKINSSVGKNTQFITIKNTSLLTEVDLSEVENLVELQIIENDSLKNVNLSRLSVVDDRIMLSKNYDTLSLDLSGLTTVYGAIEATNNNWINYDLSSLITLNTFVIDDHYNHSVTFPVLQELNLLEIKNNVGGVVTCDFPELTSLNSLSVADNLYVKSIDVSLPKLTFLSDVLYSNNSSDDLSSFSPGFEHLEGIDYLNVSNNWCLPEQLTFTNLTHFKYIQISNNNITTQVNFPQLVETAGSLYIRDNPQVSSVKMSELMKIGSLDINSNPALTSVSIPVLTEAYGLSIVNNISLSGFNAESLKIVESSLGIRGNAAMTDFSLSLLDSAYNITIYNNSVLSVINFENLLKVGNLNISSNEGLVNVQFPKLTTHEEQFSIYDNGLLANINIDLIETIGNLNIYLDNNAFNSEMVNYLLARLVGLNPSLSEVTIELMQSTPAPPTDQGITDKETLVTNGNTVNTD